MRYFKLLILCLFITPTFLFAKQIDLQNQAHWQTDFTALSVSNAGTNSYGDAISSNNNSQLLQAETKSTFGFRLGIHYFQQQNTWNIVYTNYAPTWKTNSTTNSDYSDNVYYTGKNRLQKIEIQHGYLYFVNQQLSVNLHAGFGYVDLKSSSNFNGTYVGSSTQFNHGESSFSGTGPNVGVNLYRQMGQHFSFSNSANIALFYGSFNASSNTINNTGTIANSSTDPKHDLLVPSLNVNFTLGYHEQIVPHEILHAELGIQFEQFFDAAKSHSAVSNDYENVAFYGPFLRVGYIF